MIYTWALGVGHGGQIRFQKPTTAQTHTVGGHASRRPKPRKIFLKGTSRYGNFCLPLTKGQDLRVIAKKILRDFWTKHSGCEQHLKSWYREAEKSEWKNTNEIKKDYPTASILGDNRVVFNIKGNNYRLIVKINFYYQMTWIRFIGTHKEYDRINANKI